MMQLGFLAGTALVLLSGCAASLRAGPQAQLMPKQGGVVGGGAVTFAGGFGTVDDDGHSSAFQITTPATINVDAGRRGTVLSSVEVGQEVAAVFANRLGLHAGARVGFGLAGVSGAYVGVRGGPALTLSRIAANQWLPTLTLEALGAVGLGAGVAGLGITFGWDRYGEPIRIP
jgi:hypothetical protein